MVDFLVQHPGVIVGLGVLVIIGLFHRSIRQIPKEAMTPLIQATSDARQAISRGQDALKDWMGRVSSDSRITSPGKQVNYLGGGLVLTLACVLGTVADFSFTQLFFEALGFDKYWSHVFTGAYLCATVAFGLILLDVLGFTDMAPWHLEGRPVLNAVFTGLVSSLVLGTLVLSAFMGLYRAEALLSDVASASPSTQAAAGDPFGAVAVAVGTAAASTQPTTGAPQVSEWQARSVRCVMIGSALILTTAAILTGMGLSLVWTYLGLLVAALLLGVMFAGSTLLEVLRRLQLAALAMILMILELPMRVGIMLVRAPVTALRQLREGTAPVKGERAGWLNRIARALTDWVDDTEIPVEPIGNKTYLDPETTGQQQATSGAAQAQSSLSSEMFVPPTAAKAPPSEGTARSGAGQAADPSWDPYGAPAS